MNACLCSGAIHGQLLFQVHVDGVASRCNNVVGSLETLAQHRVQETAHHWNEEIKSTSDAVSQFASDQDSKLKKMQSTVDKYVSEDLQKDLPTGIVGSDIDSSCSSVSPWCLI